MLQKISTKKFTSNVVLSIFVQVVSLSVSFVLNLIVPKFIDEYQYSYWQLYVLYSGYVGVLHFGILDGLVLRYSQYDYEDIDRQKIRSQFQSLLIITTFLSLICLAVSFISLENYSKWIVVFIAFAIISKNVYTYTQYTFQITNRINKYAIVVISQRVVYGIVVVILLCLQVNNFAYYCLADILGDLVAIVIGSFFNKGMYFGKTISIKQTILELKENISAGIFLMMANWSSMLINGSAKMIVEWRWNELLFGKLSFAFSLTHIFLTFVVAISVVLFPSLKRMDNDKLPELYGKIRKGVSLVLFLSMLAYFPGCWILEKWIPKYYDSLEYLGYLLPIIIFSSKVSLLSNNYLKVYRKEKQLMIINISSVFLAVILFVFSAYVLSSIKVLLCCVVFVIMANSIASEIVISKLININNKKNYVIETVVVACFIVFATTLSRWIGMAFYFVIFIVYVFIEIYFSKREKK